VEEDQGAREAATPRGDAWSVAFSFFFRAGIAYSSASHARSRLNLITLVIIFRLARADLASKVRTSKESN
jgi:hypothetical protein